MIRLNRHATNQKCDRLTSLHRGSICVPMCARALLNNSFECGNIKGSYEREDKNV